MSETVIAPKSMSFTSFREENKQVKTHIEEYRKAPITTKARGFIFTGMMVGGVLLAGMFALQILTGIVALVSLGIAGAGAWFGLKALKAADPIIAQKIKNKQLEIMVSEARKNAVFQLDNEVINRKDRLEKARKSRDKMKAAVESMRRVVDEETDDVLIERFQVKLKSVENAYTQVAANIDGLAENDKAFKLEVNRFKKMDKVTDMANEAMSFFDQCKDTELNDMLSLEAFDSIATEFDQAIISIENNAHDMAVDAAA